MKGTEIISGDLLDFPNGINAIAHSCNTLNIMGGGIAKQIKDRFPQAWEADCEASTQSKNTLGEYSKGELESIFLENKKGKIYNLYTQSNIAKGIYHWSDRQVNYNAFWQAMKNMQEDLLFVQHETGKSQVLGLPHGISCGLAGGSWKIIKAMIEDIFLDSLIKTYIVKYVK